MLILLKDNKIDFEVITSKLDSLLLLIIQIQSKPTIPIADHRHIEIVNDSLKDLLFVTFFKFIFLHIFEVEITIYFLREHSD